MLFLSQLPRFIAIAWMYRGLPERSRRVGFQPSAFRCEVRLALATNMRAASFLIAGETTG
jgi:hypothetical protein